MPVQIVNRNISDIGCDAIVESSFTHFNSINTGEAYISADHSGEGYVIYVSEPIWSGGKENEFSLLRSCYINSMILAASRGVKSVAFPLIASNTVGFPRDRLIDVAQQAISDYLSVSGTDMDVFISVEDKNSYELKNKARLNTFILGGEYEPQCYAACSMENRTEKKARLFGKTRKLSEDVLCGGAAPVPVFEEAVIENESLENWLKQHDDSFAVTLLKLIDKKGMTDVECYKKANISRKTFYKINNEADYRPSKQTVLAFAIALGLTLEETEILLKTVGFSLSHSSKFDMIIEFYIRNQIYDIYEINAALYQYDQPTLGC